MDRIEKCESSMLDCERQENMLLSLFLRKEKKLNDKTKIRYLNTRRALIDRFFQRMNQKQKEALFVIDGPILILAGAGSGKTTVIINRIANMIRFGDAYTSDRILDNITEEAVAFLEACVKSSEPVPDAAIPLLKGRTIAPHNILAITFTNKAAGELKTRLSTMLGREGAGVTAKTFHSTCAQILRQEIDKLGYRRDFTIYDADDCTRVMKDVLKELQMDPKKFEPKSILSAISKAKDELVGPSDFEMWFERKDGNTYLARKYAKAYQMYQGQLRLANAVDFDDLIVLTVLLFKRNKDVLAYYQNKYRYLLVDEYQDTDHAQFELVRLLSGNLRNICVVGDDDQSIYKFRGATIRNILQFEKCFPGARVFRLEQNYRSTRTILTAANNVIANNISRKGKTLWTKNETGQKLQLYQASDERDEAAHICGEIIRRVKLGEKLAKFVVLYRTNAQSQVLERCMVENHLPYKIVGGFRFYDRKEVKDILAYLTLLIHPEDNMRLKRVLNVPKRGIGTVTMETIIQIAQREKKTLYEVVSKANYYQELDRNAPALVAFGMLLKKYATNLDQLSLADLIKGLVKDSGYDAMMRSKKAEGESMRENIDELISAATRYEESTENATLASFLEDITLFSELDKSDENADFVTMMSIHASKGLEFDTVFLAGMEDGIFPHFHSFYEKEDMEEERRLAYVAITRAEKILHISYAEQRMSGGDIRKNKPSRFLDEIPENLKEIHFNEAASEKENTRTSDRLREQINTIRFVAGNRVRHSVFGNGWIISLTKEPGGSSTAIVMFDDAGQKKLDTSFLVKI